MWSDPAGGRNRTARSGLVNEKERALCEHSRMRLGTALMPTGRNANARKWQHVAAILHGRHTANHHHLAVWYGCQSSRSAFRPFGIPTRSRSNRQTVRFLYIDYTSHGPHSVGANAKCRVWQAVLFPRWRTPQEFRFDNVQLQAVRLHPLRHTVDTGWDDYV